VTPRFEQRIRAAINKLRRQWPPIIATKKRAKIGPELYKCEECEQIIYSGDRSIDVIRLDHPNAIVDSIAIDHKIPVMPVEGKKLDWNEYIKSVFCDTSNLQALCSSCHSKKTLGENKERRENRKKLKK
jgi:hypothetical protein